MRIILAGWIRLVGWVILEGWVILVHSGVGGLDYLGWLGYISGLGGLYMGLSYPSVSGCTRGRVILVGRIILAGGDYLIGLINTKAYNVDAIRLYL